MHTAHALDPAVTVAGFWRRLAAFVIDILLLGALGMVLGLLFHAQFAGLGVWGRAVGFVIAVVYFGATDSRRGGAGSPGKRIFRLRVVTGSGAGLGAPAAFCRAAIFCLAYFLNGVSLTPRPGYEWVAVLQSVLIGVLILSVFYLLLFNRRTRQSLHDLAVGAYVVKAGPGAFAPPALPVWRGHYAIVGAAVLALAAGGLLLLKQATVAGLLTTQEAIGALPDIDRVSVNINTMLTGQTRTQSMLIGGVVDASLGDPEALATTMANLALDTYPGAQAQQQIVVRLAAGYDIGIASGWRWINYALSPAQWRARAKKTPA